MADTNTGNGLSLPLAGSPLLRALADNWWLLLVRGIAAMAFGVLAFGWPGLTLLTLTMLWGAYARSDGVLSLWAAISGQAGKLAPRWWLAVIGIAGILAGLLTFFSPGMTALMLLMFIAGWAMTIGVLQIWGAIQLRKEIQNEWLLALSGVLAISFGLYMTIRPGEGAVAVIWTIGSFAILVGCIYVGLAFQLKKHKSPT